jgi:hypothetical protein
MRDTRGEDRYSVAIIGRWSAWEFRSGMTCLGGFFKYRESRFGIERPAPDLGTEALWAMYIGDWAKLASGISS